MRPAAGTIAASSRPSRPSSSIQDSIQPAWPPVNLSATAMVSAPPPTGRRSAKASADTSVASTPSTQSVNRPGNAAGDVGGVSAHLLEPLLVFALQAGDGVGVGVARVGIGERLPGSLGGARQVDHLRGRAGGHLGREDRRHDARLRERRGNEQQRADQQHRPRVRAVEPEGLDEDVRQALLGAASSGAEPVWLVGHGSARVVARSIYLIGQRRELGSSATAASRRPRASIYHRGARVTKVEYGSRGRARIAVAITVALPAAGAGAGAQRAGAGAPGRARDAAAPPERAPAPAPPEAAPALPPPPETARRSRGAAARRPRCRRPRCRRAPATRHGDSWEAAVLESPSRCAVRGSPRRSGWAEASTRSASRRRRARHSGILQRAGDRRRPVRLRSRRLRVGGGRAARQSRIRSIASAVDRSGSSAPGPGIVPTT